MKNKQNERKVRLAGMGKALAGRQVCFDDQIRYRLAPGETLLDLAQRAAEEALEHADMKISDMDCIVCAMATPLQGIPCNAALIHERMAKGLNIPAMDINTTCTSFLSALDTMSYLLAAGRYERVLILSGDTASAALNPGQKESYELFSDAAAAAVLTCSQADEPSAILYGCQRTWSEGAHDTEIRGGAGLLPALALTEDNREDYYFDMKGIKILRLCARILPDFVEECLKEADVRREDIRLTIPHQASKALGVIMSRLDFEKGTYIDRVQQYGNMVSASIPYALCEAIEEGRIHRDDLVLLMGTAAGLTVNFLLLRY
ncbi:MAG: 3-oxoacyl-ACP synthase [Acetatifactor sp.]|nr:3-oxoacyl-ACP synthase [Acetatifactor sp.]MDE7352214.1 3-oxoacyl-ACP synthase [Acetatifactor sp.]